MKSIVSYIKESEGFSEQEYEKLKNELIKYKFNFGCIDDRRLIQIWQDEMDLDYRYLTLMEIGFTGLVHEDSLDEFGEVSVNGGSVSHGLGCPILKTWTPIRRRTRPPRPKTRP